MKKLLFLLCFLISSVSIADSWPTFSSSNDAFSTASIKIVYSVCTINNGNLVCANDTHISPLLPCNSGQVSDWGAILKPGQIAHVMQIYGYTKDGANPLFVESAPSRDVGLTCNTAGQSNPLMIHVADNGAICAR